MKVAINADFGGFSLSPLAVKMLCERKGRECYFFTGGLSEPLKRVALEEIGNTLFWHAYDIPDVSVLPSQDNWGDMSMEDRQRSNAEWSKHSIECRRPDDRTDPDLIAVIEALGAKANGRCATLKIIEVPDDVKWEIDEYDGYEKVAEVHRTWG